jgi:hypothetical protein
MEEDERRWKRNRVASEEDVCWTVSGMAAPQPLLLPASRFPDAIANQQRYYSPQRCFFFCFSAL